MYFENRSGRSKILVLKIHDYCIFLSRIFRIFGKESKLNENLFKPNGTLITKHRNKLRSTNIFKSLLKISRIFSINRNILNNLRPTIQFHRKIRIPNAKFFSPIRFCLPVIYRTSWFKNTRKPRKYKETFSIEYSLREDTTKKETKIMHALNHCIINEMPQKDKTRDKIDDSFTKVSTKISRIRVGA